MLFGEHSVVHKYPCLVTAVDLRFQVSLEKIDAPSIIIETPLLSELGEPFSLPINEVFNDKFLNQHTKFIVASIRKVFSRFNIQQSMRIKSSGPVNSFGLGSSSAVTVATVLALLKLFDIPSDNQLIFDLAYAAVLEVQTLGSGFDVASAIYGGTLLYQMTLKPEVLPVDHLPLVIGYSGSKVNTTNLVKKVEHLRLEFPEIVELIFKAIGEITNAARIAILQSNWQTAGNLANINQGLLDGLGISTPSLNAPILVSRQNGAFGAKLSGAGGGDCMFAIIDEKIRSQVEQAMEASGVQVLHLGTNVEGVRLESDVA